MAGSIRRIIEEIEQELIDGLSPDSDHYKLIDLGGTCEAMGQPELAERYEGTKLVAPLLGDPTGGFPVAVDGKDLKGYTQLESGLAVPEDIAIEAGLPGRAYKPSEKMVLHII